MIQEYFESFSASFSVVVVVVFSGFRDNLVPRVYALPTKKAQGRQMGEGGPKGRQPSSLLVIVVDGFHSDVIKL